jgi:hypothetical protein
MTNEQRKIALAKARRLALEYAEMADAMTGRAQGSIYQPEADSNPAAFDRCAKLADMWAHIAQCMKTGGAFEADGVLPDIPLGGDGYVPPILTRDNH